MMDICQEVDLFSKPMFSLVICHFQGLSKGVKIFTLVLFSYPGL